MSKDARRRFSKAKPDSARLLAFDIIQEVNRRDGYSNLLLPKALTESHLDERDRAFATELVYGTLRMQGLYDYIFSSISSRPWSEVDADLVDAARMGAHQILSMRTPAHAAVSSTVDVIRRRSGESQGSFLNALLRRLTSESYEYWISPILEIDDDIARLSILYSHPEWIVSSYSDLLKDIDLVELELKSNNTPAAPTLVSWPGESTQEDLVRVGAVATRFSPYGASFRGSPASLELIKERRAGVQDEGSQLVAEIFAKVTSQASTTLDLCAGPGGKAALLSHICIVDKRTFVANEISPTRADLVRRVVAGSEVITGDGRTIGSSGRTFDAVIADVPCTGLGALRRRPEVRWRRSLSDLSSLIQLQMELVDSAILALKEGGYFGYATCSPHFAETSAQVLSIKRKYPELEQIDLQPFLPEGLDGALRDGALSLWGHRHGMDSMYLAIFKKIGAK